MRHKAFRSQLGPIEVAARQPDPADVQLAGHPGRDGPVAGVEYKARRAGNRAPDRDQGRAEPAHRPLAKRRVDRRFGRPVEVADHGAAEADTEAACQRFVEGLAARNHIAQPRRRQGRLLRQGTQSGGNHLKDRDGMIANLLSDLFGVALRAHGCENDRGTAGQRMQQLDQTGVEADRGQGQHAVRGLQRHLAAQPVAVVAEGAVFEQHALGLAARARGVDHTGQVAGQRVEAGLFAVPADQQFGVFVEAQHMAQGPGPGGRKFVEQVRLGQQHRGYRVAQLEVQALTRQLRVHRCERSAGLQHGQQRHQQFRCAVHADAHPHLGPDTQATQDRRQPIRLRVELLIAQPPLVEQRGDGARRALHLLLEPAMQGDEGHLGH